MLSIALTSILGTAGCGGGSSAQVAVQDIVEPIGEPIEKTINDITFRVADPVEFEQALIDADAHRWCLGNSGCGHLIHGNSFFAGESVGVVRVDPWLRNNVLTFNVNVYRFFGPSGSRTRIITNLVGEEVEFELLDIYGNDYHYFDGSIDIDRSDDNVALSKINALILYVTNYAGGRTSGSDFYYGGTWLERGAHTNGKIEVLSFTSADRYPETKGNDFSALTGTATYGAINDGSAEANGFFFSDDRVLTRFFADAELTLNFQSETELGEISGRVTNANNDYFGPAFTLTLEPDKLSSFTQGLLHPTLGIAVGETGGALIDENWKGQWAGGLLGGEGISAPKHAYGNFKACNHGSSSGTECAPEAGAIIGTFIAPVNTP